MRHRSIYLLMLLFLYAPLAAQPPSHLVPYMDSLRAVVDGPAPDSIRLKACQQYVLEINLYDSTSTMIYAEKGKAMARSLEKRHTELSFDYLIGGFFYESWQLDTALVITQYVDRELEKIDYKGKLFRLTKRRIADIFFWDYQFDSALHYYHITLQDKNAKQDLSWYSDILWSMANIYSNLRVYNEAIRLYSESAQISKKNGHHTRYFLSLRGLAQTYEHQGKLQDALAVLHQGLEMARQLENIEEAVNLLGYVGYLHKGENEFQMALQYYDSAKNLSLEAGKEQSVALIDAKLGSLYLDYENYKLASECYEEGLAIVKGRKEGMYVEPRLQMGLAAVKVRQGAYREAYEIYRKNVEFQKMVREDSAQVVSLNLSGGCLYHLEEYQEALSIFEEAMDLSQQIQFRQGIAKNYLSMSHVYSQLQQENIAGSYLDSAIYYFEKLTPNSNALMKAYGEIGDEYRNQANLTEAIKFYDQALDIAAYQQDTLFMGSVYNRFASLYHGQGDFVSATQFLTKSLELYRSVEYMNGLAATKTGQAALMNLQKDYDSALEYALNAVAIYDANQNNCQTCKPLQLAGEAYLHQQQVDSALSYLRQAEKSAALCGNFLQLAHITMHIAEAYLQQGQKQQAFAYFRIAFQLAKRSKNREVLMKTARALYPLFEERGQPVEAYEVFKVFHASSDSLNKKENSRALIGKELAYEHEKELQAEKITRLEKEAALKQQTIYTYLAAGGILCLVLVLMSYYKNYKEKQRKNRLLSAQNEEIARQKAELQSLDELKSRLFANISHELRTPLTLISSPLKKLLTDEIVPLSSCTKSTLQLMERNTRQLKELVDDILDLSKLESEVIALEEMEVDMHSFLNRVFSNFSSLAQHQRIEYHIDIEKLPDESMIIDSGKLEKILNNLLSNAIKYTGAEGTVELTSFVEKERLVLKVRDTGKGISKEDLPYVFDRFYQGENPDSALQGGTGIGLALAYELCQLMNGSIDVGSQAGEGSTFVVLLPYQPVISSSESPITSDFPVLVESMDDGLWEDSGKEIKSATVLIVEDHKDMLMFLSTLLSPYHQTLLAGNGQQALDILKKKSVDLIISDVMMPEMDGYTLLKTLKDQDDYRSIPVIMLTALGDELHRLQALTIGVDDYLAKPFSPVELLARVNNLLHRSEERRRWQQTEEIQYQQISENDAGVWAEVIDHQVSSADMKWLQEVATALEGELENEDFRLSELAARFFLGERQFQRKIKNITGLTPKKYQQEVAMQKARQLLESGKARSLKEVAASVGIYQTYRFVRFYETRFGKHPSEYFEVTAG